MYAGKPLPILNAGLNPSGLLKDGNVDAFRKLLNTGRDIVTTIVETNLTLQGNRLNVITKKVTSWAAIIAVPTAITGWYGQNLPYPGFAKTSGLVTSAGLIVVISTALYFAFKRRDWL